MEDRIIEAFEHCMAGELDEAQAIVDALLREAPEDEEVAELAAHLAHLRGGAADDPAQLMAAMQGDGILPGQALGTEPAEDDGPDGAGSDEEE